MVFFYPCFMTLNPVYRFELRIQKHCFFITFFQPVLGRFSMTSFSVLQRSSPFGFFNPTQLSIPAFFLPDMYYDFLGISGGSRPSLRWSVVQPHSSWRRTRARPLHTIVVASRHSLSLQFGSDHNTLSYFLRFHPIQISTLHIRCVQTQAVLGRLIIIIIQTVPKILYVSYLYVGLQNFQINTFAAHKRDFHKPLRKKKKDFSPKAHTCTQWSRQCCKQWRENAPTYTSQSQGTVWCFMQLFMQ